MNRWRRNKGEKYALLLGHRGAMGLAPENTVTSIKMALEYNVDLFEIDVHLSNDKKIIVMHDEKVDRTTTGTGYISQLSSKYIKSLDAGMKFSERFKGERVPFLEEIFELMKYNHVLLNIEIKNGPVFYKGIEKQVIQLIDRYNYYERIIISSFDHYTLKTVKEINKNIYTGLLYGCNILNFEEYVEKLQVAAVHPHYHWVTKELIKKMHKRNIAVNTWVVNDPQEYKKFSRMGVDSIGTNFPDRMKF